MALRRLQPMPARQSLVNNKVLILKEDFLRKKKKEIMALVSESKPTTPREELAVGGVITSPAPRQLIMMMIRIFSSKGC